MTTTIKTIRRRIQCRPSIPEWFALTEALFKRAVVFPFDAIRALPGVRELWNQKALIPGHASLIPQGIAPT